MLRNCMDLPTRCFGDMVMPIIKLVHQREWRGMVNVVLVMVDETTNEERVRDERKPSFADGFRSENKLAR